MTPAEKLLKELRREEQARQRERASKLARFHEILEILNK